MNNIPNVRIMTPMTMEIKETTAQFYQLDLEMSFVEEEEILIKQIDKR